MTEEKDRMLVEYETSNGMVKLNPNIVRRYLVHGKAALVTDTEIVIYMQQCRFLGMNPFLRDCYLIKYSSDDPASIVVGKDWFTKKSASIPACEGYNAGVVVGVKKGNRTVVERRIGTIVRAEDDEELIGGWATARRKGWAEPIEIEVSLKEYMRYSKKGEPVKNWRIMPATMIRKVALVQALRDAFPDVYAGLYSAEEMPVDDSALPKEPVEVPGKSEPSLSVREEQSNGHTDEPAMTKKEEEAASKAFDKPLPAREEEFDTLIKDNCTIERKKSLPQPDETPQKDLEIF